MEQGNIITSKRNERIRAAKRLQQKKARDQQGLFYLEGVRIVEEALNTPLVETVFFAERLLGTARGQALIAFARQQGVPTFQCTDDVLSELTDTVQSQGVVAVVKKPSWPRIFSGVMLVADAVQDPGNMGTLLRTAVGAGCTGLYVVEGSVDLYNPKVLRSSMGAIFHLPHWLATRKEMIELVQANNLALVIADLADSESFWAVRYPQDMAVVIGNEARGVHPEFRKHATVRVKIPLEGAVESLNAPVAAGVLLYEILRQHRCANPSSVL